MSILVRAMRKKVEGIIQGSSLAAHSGPTKDALSPIKLLANRITGSELARNTFWMILGNGLKMVIQAVYFILIARSLRSQGYGAFVGVSALVGLLAPFAGLGCGSLLIKNVSRNKDCFSQYLGKSLLMVLMAGSVLLLGLMCVSRVILPTAIPLSLVLVIGISELFFAQFLDITAQAFQAFERLKRTALIQVLPNIFRLIAIALLSMLVQAPTVIQWCYLYLVSTVISALVGMWLVHKELGSPVFTLAGMKAEIREGFYFSISSFARGVNNDIDKTMLARLSTLEATGIYGAAYRIMAVSFTPILSLLYAAYAKFFQHGAGGIKGTLRFAKRLFPLAGVYGVAIGVALVAASPLLPLVLGEEYTDAANALRWLAPLPFLKAVQFFAADSLTGAGYQGVRSGIQVIAAVFNVVINIQLIPAYSWRGAAWASLASDGFMSVLLILALFIVSTRTSKAEGVSRL